MCPDKVLAPLPNIFPYNPGFGELGASDSGRSDQGIAGKLHIRNSELFVFAHILHSLYLCLCLLDPIIRNAIPASLIFVIFPVFFSPFNLSISIVIPPLLFSGRSVHSGKTPVDHDLAAPQSFPMLTAASLGDILTHSGGRSVTTHDTMTSVRRAGR